MSSSRRKFIGTAAALAAGTVAASATPLTNMEKKYPVVHHVFFWLKNPDSKADRDQLIEGIKGLKEIETVHKMHVGVQASTEKRDVVDVTWNVSELIYFEDVAAQAIYQDHPIHVAFVKKYSSLWQKVVVYDVIEA